MNEEIIVKPLMSFSEWIMAIAKLDCKIQELEDKISYREIQVLGPKEPPLEGSCSRRIYDEERDQLRSDITYIELNSQLTELTRKRNYIKMTGRMPIPASDVIDL